MSKRSLILAAFLILTVISPSFEADAEQATHAVVTFLDGFARTVTGDGKGRTLKKGDKLGREHEVRVGSKSRIEIRFPDGTIMRLCEGSRLAMKEVLYDKKTKNKNLKVGLVFGKLWATVKKLVTADSSVEVSAGNAVAGVRGTVYRVNVEEDQSAMVKVYDGSVYVAGRTKDEPEKHPAQFSPPVPVPGPHEVPPPMHEVTMEEWHVIVNAMQQIFISSQGVASPPHDFDPVSDADEWVKWNQGRDKQAQF